MEIERKWLLRAVPEHDIATHSIVNQFYLSTGDTEVRLRKYTPIMTTFDYLENKAPYLLTVKAGHGMVREEVETVVDSDFYNKCRDLIDRKPIVKSYYTYEINGKTIEVSNVDYRKFIYAEVEFDSVEEANAYSFPFADLVIKEITNIPGFSMQDYWENNTIPVI